MALRRGTFDPLAECLREPFGAGYALARAYAQQCGRCVYSGTALLAGLGACEVDHQVECALITLLMRAAAKAYCTRGRAARWTRAGQHAIHSAANDFLNLRCVSREAHEEKSVQTKKLLEHVQCSLRAGQGVPFMFSRTLRLSDAHLARVAHGDAKVTLLPHLLRTLAWEHTQLADTIRARVHTLPLEHDRLLVRWVCLALSCVGCDGGLYALEPLHPVAYRPPVQSMGGEAEAEAEEEEGGDKGSGNGLVRDPNWLVRAQARARGGGAKG